MRPSRGSTSIGASFAGAGAGMGSPPAMTVAQAVSNGKGGRREVEFHWMLCAEDDSLRQEHRAAVKTFRASIRGLVVLVENSAADSDFPLAHLRIRAACGACEVARAIMEHHRVEHGCCLPEA